MSNIVQYVVVRSDLLKDGWSIGALIGQACHASTAALHLFNDDPQTIEYLQDLDGMRKIILEVPDEKSLRKLSTKLQQSAISHKMWMEQHENIPTCIALKPYGKEDVKKYIGKFKLYNIKLE